MPDVRAEVMIAAPAERVWSVLMDWPRQAEWILGTRVRVATGDGASVGSTLEAWTGVGPLGFLDTMTITAWDPPRRCDVVHTGRVVRGTGSFIVQPVPGGRTRFLWREDLEIPLGAAGHAGWTLIRPATEFGIRRSLNRLAALVEAEALTA
jgi:uncharacterized protein YndB with AHSA1/START domain